MNNKSLSKPNVEKVHYKNLFKRSIHNPILTSADWPYPAHTVFNPGAVSVNGNILLLARVEDRRGFSHITKAISKNGETDWIIDNKPTILPEPGLYPEEKWGIEDPRITWLADCNKWVITYVAYSCTGPLVSLALTSDFIKFKKKGAIMAPEDKNAALFPKKIGNKYMLIHRPYSENHRAHIWISTSKNLKHWGDNQILLKSREGGWWDSSKIGISAPPLETKMGWLILYHGVKQTATGYTYRLGLALLDLENPAKILKRSDEWIFGPEAEYEKFGEVSDVVFSCGWVHNPKTDQIKMYYGGADSCICLATAQLSDLLNYLEGSTDADTG